MKNEKMKFQNALTLPIGMIFLATAMVMEKFLPGNDLYDFVEGVLIGLSVILNIYYIGISVKKNNS